MSNIINDSIMHNTIRLVNDDGSQDGIVSISYALEKANNLNLDLVLINEKSNPAICKIMDYGKYKYEKSKFEKDQRSKNKKNEIQIKEIQLRPTTDLNDISIKAKKCNKFLNDGNHVRIIVKFKGRENSYIEYGNNVIDKFLSKIDVYKDQKPLAISEKQISITISKN